ncbi:MAG: helix-turn-helix domain-containing protein [Treponema sp.]|jgi:hypothetical protein|nr:helix-turn-helix domain-containing protein [Treponema sp.]
MAIINLFLALFTFMLFCFTSRNRLMQVLFIQDQTIKVLLRTLEQHNLRASFEPQEKFLIATLLENTPGAERFFNLATTKTVLTVWKNIFTKARWTQKKRKPGRPPINKEIKELILKFKQDNFLWGARRIRDELLKLSIDVSHETISKIIQHSMKTGDVKPALSWKRFLSSHWKTIFACDFFTVDIFGFKRF